MPFGFWDLREARKLDISDVSPVSFTKHERLKATVGSILNRQIYLQITHLIAKEMDDAINRL